jgi:TatD DNase family protein
LSSDLPPIDCHAHIAVDVTTAQLARLGPIHLFAVTRSLAEAAVAVQRKDDRLVWGCGVHPGDSNALGSFDKATFRELATRFCLIGEVGLDGRAGNADLQRVVLRDVLDIIAGMPLIISIHSTAASSAVLDIIERRPHSGAVLHWYTGGASEIARAVKLGCYFSANAAMRSEQLALLPMPRVLPETDFPASRRRGGGNFPGDTEHLEVLLGQSWGMPPEDVRRQLYRNLRDIAAASGAIERLPDSLADTLMIA